MRAKILSAVAVGLLAVGLAWSGTSALAAEPSAPGVAVAKAVFAAPNPQAAYAALTPAKRSAFNQAEVPTSKVVLGGGSSLANRIHSAEVTSFSGTFWDSAKWAEKAAAGNTLYTWWQATKVWITSGHVTKVQVYNYGYETSTPGWRTDGISTKTYNASWEGRGLVIAKMVLGVAGWDIQHTTNCGQIRLNGDAKHYAISTSCDLN